MVNEDDQDPSFDNPGEEKEMDPEVEGFDEEELVKEGVEEGLGEETPMTETEDEREESFQELEEGENESEEIIIEAGEGYFEPADIEVSQGDTIRLTLTSREGAHQLVVPELLLETETAKEGEQATIDYTFEEPGEFDFVCGVHGEEMSGTILVKGEEEL